MVTLILEDGTGIATANTFALEVTADTYWTDHGAPITWSGATSAVKTQALVAAAQYLNNKSWASTASNGTQGLAFPRKRLRFDGFAISSTVIPQRIIDAQMILAHHHILDGGLYTDISAGAGNVSQLKSKIGELEETFVYVGSSNSQKSYSEVEMLVRPFLNAGGDIVRS